MVGFFHQIVSVAGRAIGWEVGCRAGLGWRRSGLLGDERLQRARHCRDVCRQGNNCRCLVDDFLVSGLSANLLAAAENGCLLTAWPLSTFAAPTRAI